MKSETRLTTELQMPLSFLQNRISGLCGEVGEVADENLFRREELAGRVLSVLLRGHPGMRSREMKIVNVSSNALVFRFAFHPFRGVSDASYRVDVVDQQVEDDAEPCASCDGGKNG